MSGTPLRIALIAASPRILGGHSVQAQQLRTNLIAAGHDVVFIPVDVAFPDALRWLRRLRYLRTIVNEFLYVFSLRRVASCDIVHIFSASYWSFVLAPLPAMIAAKLCRRRVVLHYHSGEADDHLRRWRVTVRHALGLADEIVVPSAYLREIFLMHGYDARIIPNIVDTSAFTYRRRVPLRPSLLSVRNLEPYYRVDTTIHALTHVKRLFPQATLTIVGVGAEENALRRLVSELRLDGVRFVGGVDSADIPALYDAADIFVNSSVVDNQPVSILEAFAAGLPVISTPTGDIHSMLRGGEAGALVPLNDPEAIANAVCEWVEHPDVADRIARRGHDEVERYTWRRAGHLWKSLYAELLSATPVEVVAHGA